MSYFSRFDSCTPVSFTPHQSPFNAFRLSSRLRNFQFHHCSKRRNASNQYWPGKSQLSRMEDEDKHVSSSIAGIRFYQQLLGKCPSRKLGLIFDVVFDFTILSSRPITQGSEVFPIIRLGTALRNMTLNYRHLWSYLNGPCLIGLLTHECTKGNLNSHNQSDLVFGDYDFSLILPKCSRPLFMQ